MVRADQVLGNRFDYVQNGPRHPYERKCTDVFCCILIIINFCLLLSFAIYGYAEGNISNIYRATDEGGNICGGKKSNANDYPFSYFYNPTTNDLSKRTCVKACPSYQNGVLQNIDCYSSGNSLNKCSYDTTVNQDGSYSSISPSSSQIISYDSKQIIGRVCIPREPVFNNAFSAYKGAFSSGLRQAGVGNFIIDVQNNWKWILLTLVLSVFISFIFLLLLRCTAGCFVWVSLIVLELLLIALGLIFLYNGGAISRDSFVGNLGIPILPQFGYYNIFGYVTFGVAAIFLIAILCCCGRIKLVVALCVMAGQFIGQTCQVMLVPIIMSIVIFALWIFAILAMLCLIGTANFVSNGNSVFTSIQSYSSSSLGFFYYFIFGTLWTTNLIAAISIFVVALACANWYYSRGPGVKLDSPVREGFYMAFRYHFGSLAFGAFIMTFIQFIQFIFQILHTQMAPDRPRGNSCYECLIECIRCCLQCLKRILQMLNKNAYIQIAITGKNFCSASSDAVALITVNPLRYTLVIVVEFLLTLLGKCLIAGLTTFLFYILITFNMSVKENVQQPIYLLILVGITSYAMALTFMSVFEVSVDTLLACYIIDEGSNIRPIHAPQQLIQIMNH